jgi:hypothetical protein
MKIAEKQLILEALNSLEFIETNGGEEAYILVENNDENHKILNEVGISSETINRYGDEETFCILALAFSEGYCDLYEHGKLIAFDKSIELEVGNGKSVILYKHEGKSYLTLSEDS